MHFQVSLCGFVVKVFELNMLPEWGNNDSDMNTEDSESENLMDT